MTPTPQLIRLIQEQDREMLRKLEALVPEGPKDAECIAEAIEALRKRLGITVRTS